MTHVDFLVISEMACPDGNIPTVWELFIDFFPNKQVPQFPSHPGSQPRLLSCHHLYQRMGFRPAKFLLVPGGVLRGAMPILPKTTETHLRLMTFLGGNKCDLFLEIVSVPILNTNQPLIQKLKCTRQKKQRREMPG